MTKREGDMKFIVGFQTSHNNVPGEYVSILVAAGVRSSVIKKWREAQPNPRRNDDFIAGGLVHLLDGKNTFLEWNLADEKLRSHAITDIVNHIKNVVIPFFDMFTNTENTLKILEKKDIPTIDIGDAVEFALCFGDKEKAEIILKRYVKEHPNYILDIQKALEDLKRNGFPKYYVLKYAEQVAFLSYSYGLTID